MKGNLDKKLDMLSDDQAENCLNGILKGLMCSQPEYAEIFSSPQLMVQVIQDAAGKAPQVRESNTPEKYRAIHMILAEMDNDPLLNQRIHAWLDSARPKLLEPVTGALVLAGIVMLLSTHIKIDYEDSNGKKQLKIMVDKKSTTDKILEKFFDFFI